MKNFLNFTGRLGISGWTIFTNRDMDLFLNHRGKLTTGTVKFPASKILPHSNT